MPEIGYNRTQRLYGDALVLNPAYIVSITTARSSYGGGQANIRTENGIVHSVRESATRVHELLQAAQQGQGRG